MILFLIYLLVYSIYLVVFLWGGWKRLLTKIASNTNDESIGLENITVIIPFRNEEKRIIPLLNSIGETKHLPIEVIFVDDHSTDKSPRLIEQITNESIKLISLPNSIKGKKRAIEQGVLAANTEHILTLDADIQISQVYFLNIGKLKQADLHVLPVAHTSSNLLHRFIQQDVLLANFLNVAIAGWKRPIFCSGANLLFRKSEYLEATNNSPYFEIDSGDDVFLLREFQLNNKQIEFQTDSSLEVQTELPQSIPDFFHQRMRWLGKAFKVGDSLANTLAQLQFFFAFANIIFLLGCILGLPLTHAVSLVLLKTLLELVFSFSFYKNNGQLGLWILVPIYLLILPILNGIMLLAFLGYKPRWKDRLVVQ